MTVLDNDAAAVTSTSAADVTVWSADMTVVEYGTGSIGAGSADLFSNQGGSAALAAKWLWYDPAARTLKIAFDDGLDDAESMTLHVGEASVAFPADSGGDSSFTIAGVDVSWSDGETLTARISKPAAAAVSTDATLASLTVPGAELSPAFDAGVLVYRANVGADIETVTVKATTADDGATVSYGPAEDADGALADHQMATPAGETLVAVTVTAADGQTQRAYRVVVVRPVTVAVSFGSAAYTAVEGGEAASVTVELDTDPKRKVTIPLTATPEGGAAADDYTVADSVTFTGGGALSQTVPVTAVADDTAESGERVVLGFGSLPDGVEAGATASAAVTLADAAVNTEPTGLPTVGGTPQVGETLTASADAITDADGLDDATFAWQWLAITGTEDAEIAGATGATYEVAAEQAGKTLKVRVTFTDDKGTEETLTSAATEGVAATVPSVPVGLAAATDAGREGELTVSWSAPASDGGSEVTGYKVQWKFGTESYDGTDGSARQAVLGATAASHTIAGLVNGTAYTVRVLAVNAAGNGGAAEVGATARDRVAPVLTGAVVDETALTLTFSEALDADSKSQSLIHKS